MFYLLPVLVPPVVSGIPVSAILAAGSMPRGLHSPRPLHAAHPLQRER
jgi:hypothetical protein